MTLIASIAESVEVIVGAVGEALRCCIDPVGVGDVADGEKNIVVAVCGSSSSGVATSFCWCGIASFAGAQRQARGGGGGCSGAIVWGCICVARGGTVRGGASGDAKTATRANADAAVAADTPTTPRPPLLPLLLDRHRSLEGRKTPTSSSSSASGAKSTAANNSLPTLCPNL